MPVPVALQFLPNRHEERPALLAKLRAEPNELPYLCSTHRHSELSWIAGRHHVQKYRLADGITSSAGEVQSRRPGGKPGRRERSKKRTQNVCNHSDYGVCDQPIRILSSSPSIPPALEGTHVDRAITQARHEKPCGGPAGAKNPTNPSSHGMPNAKNREKCHFRGKYRYAHIDNGLT